MKIGVRGHDIPATSAEDFCRKLNDLGVNNIQLALPKSFPDLPLTKDGVAPLAACLASHGIHVSVLSCYIDPLTPEGQETFLHFLSLAPCFSPDVVATETATATSPSFETEAHYQAMLAAAKRFAKEAATQKVFFGFEAVKGMPLFAPNVMKRLQEELNSPWFRFIFDPANLIDTQDKSTQQRIFNEVLTDCGDFIVAIHDKAMPHIDCSQVFSFAKTHPHITVITEGLCGAALAKELTLLRK